MWQTLRVGKRLVNGTKSLYKFQRTFLSEAYQCEEAWNKRMDSSILRKISPAEMFLDMDAKFQRNDKVSAVDIDIFANVIQDKEHVDELADVLYKLRLTPEATNTLDSTHYAVVRYFLRIGDTDHLLEILNDRLNYGIFPDYFSLNILMDSFLKQQKYTNAAKVASLLMLQEDAGHPISNALALYSCHKFLEKPDDWEVKTEPDPHPGEEIRVRVAYLRNPYFDEHFDLKEPLAITGKTLAFLGKHRDDCLGRSSQLRGLILFKKYKEAAELIQDWLKKGIKEVVHEEALDLIEKDLAAISEEELTEEAKKVSSLVKSLRNADLKKCSFFEELENNVNTEVKRRADQDISDQCEMFLKWEEKRKEVLNEHLTEIDRRRRLAKVDEMKKDLKERERVLTFFEKEEKIELKIETLKKRESMEKRRAFRGRKKASIQQAVEDEYVPPEIRQKQ